MVEGLSKLQQNRTGSFSPDSSTPSSSSSSFSSLSSTTSILFFSLSLLLLLCFCHVVRSDRFELAPCVFGDQVEKEKVHDCLNKWLNEFDATVDFSRVDQTGGNHNCGGDKRIYRTEDGSCNSLEKPYIGTSGSPFASLAEIVKDSKVKNKQRDEDEPNPLEISAAVSQADLAKPKSTYSSTANALSTSWLIWYFNDVYQYEFKEGNNYNNDDKDDNKEDYIYIDASFSSNQNITGLPLPGGDIIRLPETKRLRGDKNDVQFKNLRTAFLDNDQLYGCDSKSFKAAKNSDGTVELKRNERLDPEAVGDKRVLTDYASAAMQTLWALEHNFIVKFLDEHYSFDGEELYNKARLITNAEMVKIHYTEFLPSWIDEPWVIEFAKKDWGSEKHNPDLEYLTITELLPLAYWLQNPREIALREEDNGEIVEVLNPKAALDRVLQTENGTRQVILGLAAQPAARLTLSGVSGYPTNPVVAKESHSACNDCWVVKDNLALAIIRERERGIPRYNDVRRLLGLEPIKKFSQLTSNKVLAETLRGLYGNVERIDYSVGALSEDRLDTLPLPPTMLLIVLYSLQKAQQADRLFGDHLEFDEVTSYGYFRIGRASLQSILLDALDLPKVPPHPFKIWSWNSTLNYPVEPDFFRCPPTYATFEVGWVLNLFLIVIFGMWLMAYLIEVFGRVFWYKFRKMALAHQRAVVSYILELCFQIAMLVWLLVIFVRITWIEPSVTATDRNVFQLLFVALILIALYVWELIYRVSMRWQIILHHITVTIFTMAAIYRLEQTDFLIAKTLVQSHLMLALTAVTEQPIFLALLLYRFDIKSSNIFFFSVVQNVITKLFLHSIAMYYYGYSVGLVHWDLFWAIYFPLLDFGVLLPAQLYATYAQYIIGMRCLASKRGPKPVAGLGVLPGKSSFGPPALLHMPSDL